LDFDNFNLDFNEFTLASEYVRRQLELEGFVVDIRNFKKGAYHAYIKFPEILYQHQLSQIREEKILIQLDTLSQGYEYKPDAFTLNKFGVVKKINVTPVPILLSQKIYTAFNRKRIKGRDFFDIVYLLGFTKPDLGFLKFKLNLNTVSSLKEYILEQSKTIDFKLLAKDVKPFLLNPNDSDNVLLFEDIIKKTEL
jgi:hypothetical protein